jgi:hypothetical protein
MLRGVELRKHELHRDRPTRRFSGRASRAAERGVVLRHLNNDTEAEPLFRRSLAIWEKTLGPDDVTPAVGLNNLAGIKAARGMHAHVETLYRRALALLERDRGPRHPDVAACPGCYAALLRATDRHLEAAEVEARIRSTARRQDPISGLTAARNDPVRYQ